MSATPPIWEIHATFFTRALPRIHWMLRPMTRTYFYRRSIEMRAGVAEYIVYAVQAIEGARPDPVPVIAAYPAGWVPTDYPGQCLHDRDAPQRIYDTFVPRSQFRHYQRITCDEALMLYPRLQQPRDPRQTTADDGTGPAPIPPTSSGGRGGPPSRSSGR